MFEKVCKMLGEHLGVAPGSIRPEQKIVDDLKADSLDVIELMMALEEEYGISLPEEEMENVKTVQDVVEMMERITKQ